jgi:hypothetical protein
MALDLVFAQAGEAGGEVHRQHVVAGRAAAQLGVLVDEHVHQAAADLAVRAARVDGREDLRRVPREVIEEDAEIADLRARGGAGVDRLHDRPLPMPLAGEPRDHRLLERLGGQCFSHRRSPNLPRV